MIDISSILSKIKTHSNNSVLLDDINDEPSILIDQNEFDIFIADSIKVGQNKHKTLGGNAFCFPIDNYQHGLDLINELSNHLKLKKQAHAFVDNKSSVLTQNKRMYLFVIKNRRY